MNICHILQNIVNDLLFMVNNIFKFPLMIYLILHKLLLKFYKIRNQKSQYISTITLYIFSSSFSLLYFFKRIFWGFKSRWIIRWLKRCFIPVTIYLIISSYSIRVCLFNKSYDKSMSHNSITMYLFWLSSKISTTSVTFSQYVSIRC